MADSTRDLREPIFDGQRFQKLAQICGYYRQ